MELTKKIERPAMAMYDGKDGFVLNAGDRLRFQKKEGDGNPETFLDEAVPEGKAWTVSIQVNVTEEDE